MNIPHTNKQVDSLSWRIIDIIVIVFLIVGAAIFRLNAYGDMRLSIGTVDTGVYLISSEPEIFSWEFFTTGRPPTVPLLYKLLRPEMGYELSVVSEPAVLGSERNLTYQPGFDRVVLVQTALSIACWSSLALIIFWRLKNRLTKYIAALMILAFANSPQLAEWDRILFSESVSFSLFAILLGFTIELAFRIMREGRSIKASTYGVLFGWLITLTLWDFSRDTNVYILPITFTTIIVILAWPGLWKKIPRKEIVFVSIYLILLFIFHQRTQHDSGRWILPFQSNLIYRVFPNEDRVEFFKNLGMPVTEELLTYTDLFDGPAYMNQSSEFMDWVYEDGMAAYQMFLIDYPLWAVLEVYDALEYLFMENLQPWFTGPDGVRQLTYIKMGDILHPKSHSILFINGIFSLAILFVGLYSRAQENIIWAWIVMWLLFSELFLLIISYHGDPRSTTRHALVAVMPMRLSIWLLLAIFSDISLSLAKSVSSNSRNVG